MAENAIPYVIEIQFTCRLENISADWSLLTFSMHLPDSCSHGIAALTNTVEPIYAV